MEDDLYKVFGGVGRNELAAVAVKIFYYISAQPTPVNIKHLHTTFWSDCKPPYDFDACMSYLVSTGQLSKYILTEGDKIKELVATPEGNEKICRVKNK